jgi:hypothetical protein
VGRVDHLVVNRGLERLTLTQVVKNAIQCVCVLVETVTGNTAALTSLLRECSRSFVDDSQVAQASRYLFCIGFLCRHFEANADGMPDQACCHL